jgi:hypothetical protein
MRMAVENREYADDDGRDREGQAQSGRNGPTQYESRKRNHHFGHRKRNAQHAKNASDCHDQRKCDRQDPDRRCAQLGAPKPNRDHGSEVIETGQRVQEAARQAPGHTLLLMCEGRVGYR